jgi:hypothetical protein
VALGVLISLISFGCATEKHGRLIRQEDVTWIQKGVTSTTTTTGTVEGQSKTTTTTVKESPKGTKATYLYTRSKSTVPFTTKAHTTQFWLRFDENGVVQDYGFVGDMSAGPTPK